MKPHAPALALGLSLIPQLHAADGTWTNPATGGLWSDIGNWSGGPVVDGSGSTANFNTLDITADNTVQLDSARTLGALVFGDTTTATAAGWTLSNNGSSSNILTLAGSGSSTPTITANALGTGKISTIALELAGTQGLAKAGAGELMLTGVNSYSGITTVNAGTLTLQGNASSGGSSPGGTILNSTGITISQGATLKLTNDNTNGNSANRIADGVAITLNGGTFNFGASTAGSTTFAETVGQLNMSSGSGRIITTAASGSGSSSTLTFASLNRTGGTTFSFATTTSLGAAANKILFASAPTVDDGGLIGGWATAGSQDFAAYGANGVVVATYQATNAAETGWQQQHNIKLTTGQTLTADRQVNALALVTPGAGIGLNLGGFTLRVESGGVLGSQSANGNSTISNGNLTAGNGANTAGELFIMDSQPNTRPITISANIVDNGSGAVSLVTSGNINGSASTIILSGTGSNYSGTTTIAGGETRLGFSLANNKALTVATGSTLNLGGLTHAVDGLSGGGTIGITNTAAGGASNSLLSLGNSNGSATFTGNLTASGLSGRDLDIVKNGTGTQVIAGNDFRDVTVSGSPSTTTINNGTLQFAKQVSLYNNNSSRWNATNLVVNSGGTLALNVGGSGEFTSANVDTIKALGSTTGGFKGGSSLGLDTTNAAGGNFSYGSGIGDTNAGANSVGLTKLGTGSLTLTGTSTYTGATLVSAGSLFVNGALGSTTVTVNAGATFGGTGTVGGNVTVGAASYAAGASAGSLEIAGNLNLGAGSNTAVELGGTAFTLNGTEEYDRTKLTGAASILNLGGGTLDISLINGFSLAENQAFGIFQLEETATRTGSFWGLAGDGSLVGNFGGLDLFITYSGNFSDSGTIETSGGNDIVLYTVPEPAAVALGALGMMLLLRRRRP